MKGSLAVVKKKDREKVPPYMIEPREMTDEEKEWRTRHDEVHEYYGVPDWGPEWGPEADDYEKLFFILWNREKIPSDLDKRLLGYKFRNRAAVINRVIEYINRNAPDAAFAGSSAVRFCYGGSRNPDGVDIICLNKLKGTMDAYLKAEGRELKDYIETASCEKFVIWAYDRYIDINVSVVKDGAYRVKEINGIRTISIRDIFEERLLSSGIDSLGALYDACYILDAFSNELNKDDIESASAILSLIGLEDVKKHAQERRPDIDGMDEVLKMFKSTCKKLGINRKVGLNGE